MTAHTQEASTTDTETARNAVPPPMAGRRRPMRLPLWFIILFALIVDGGFGPNQAAEGVTVNYEHQYTYSGRKEYRTRNGGGTYVDNSTFYRYDHYATRLDQQTAITITVNPGASYNAATASYNANTYITRHRWVGYEKENGGDGNCFSQKSAAHYSRIANTISASPSTTNFSAADAQQEWNRNKSMSYRSALTPSTPEVLADSTSTSGATYVANTVKNTYNHGTLSGVTVVRALAENYGVWNSATLTNNGTMLNQGTANVTGAFTNSNGATFTTKNGASLSAASLALNSGSAINATADFTAASGVPMLSATSAALGGSLAVTVVDGNATDKITVINSGTAMTGNFSSVTVNGQTPIVFSLDEYLYAPTAELSTDRKEFYVLTGNGYNWESTREKDETVQAHGNFNIGAGKSVTLSHAFADRDDLDDKTVFEGWDGKTLTKTGSGTLALSGNNTYTGETRVLEGTLAVTGDANLAGTSRVAVAAGAMLVLNPAADSTLSAPLSGAGTLTKEGAGALTLSGNSAHTGVVIVREGGLHYAAATTTRNTYSVSSGAELAFAASGTAGALSVGGTLILDSATLNARAAALAGGSSLAINRTASGAGELATGSLSIGQGVSLVLTGAWGNDAVIATGNFGGGRFASVTVNGQTNTGVLTAATWLDDFALSYNDQAGTISYRQGTLVWDNANTDQTGTLRVHGDFLVPEGTAADVTQNIADNPAAVANHAKGGLAAPTVDCDAIGLWDGRTLTKKGAGTLTLSGNNTYTGETRVLEGTLSVTGDANLAGTSRVLLDGGTLAVAGSSLSRPVALGAAGGAVSTDTATALSGVVSGAGSLAKAGSGTLTLSGNNTYAGATNVEAGTLRVTSAANLGNTSGIAIAQGALLSVDNSAAFDLSRPVSGAGSLTKTGSGTLTLSGNNTYTGATNVEAGTLRVTSAANLGNTSGIAIAQGALLSVDNSAAFDLSRPISGAGSLAKAGSGTLTLSGNNTYAGATNVEAGTLRVTSAANLGNTSGIAVAQGALLSVDNADDTAIAVVISGDGGLTKSGAGTLELTARNTYAGITTVAGGTLKIASAANLGGTRCVLLAGGDLFVENGSGSLLTVAVSGDGNVEKDGAGSLALTATDAGRDLGIVSVLGGEAVLLDNRLRIAYLDIDQGGACRVAANVHDDLHNAGTLKIDSGKTLTADNAVIEAGSTTTFARKALINVLGDVAVNGGTLNLVNPVNAKDAVTPLIVWTGEANFAAGANPFAAVTVNGAANGAVTATTYRNALQVYREEGKRLVYRSGGLVWDNTAASGLAAHGRFHVDGYNDEIPDALNDNATPGAGFGWDGKTLTKTGSGVLTLSGNNTYTGATNVEAGTLRLASAFNSNGGFNVANGAALLVEAAIVNGGGFANRGVLELPRGGRFTQAGDMNTGRVNFNGGKLAVAGNLAMTGDWRVNLDKYAWQGQGGAARGANAIVTVGGAASRATGKITLIGGTAGHKYELVKAGAAGENASLAAAIRAACGSVYRYFFDASDPRLYLVGFGINNDAFPAMPGSGIGDALRRIANDPSAAERLRDILDVLNGLSGDALRRAVNELDNREMGYTVLAGMDSAVRQQTSAALGLLDGIDAARAATEGRCRAESGATEETRRAALGGRAAKKIRAALRRRGRDACSAVYDETPLGGFALALGGFRNRAADWGTAGHDINSVGVIGGVYKTPAREIIYGAAIGYTHAGMTIRDGYGSATDNAIRFSPFVRYKWERLNFDLVAGTGAHAISSNRALRSFGRTARNDRTGLDVALAARAAAEFDAPHGFRLTPSFTLAPVYLHAPEYKENGAGTANLAVDSYNAWSLTQTLAVKAANQFRLGRVTIAAEATAGWEHDYLAAPAARQSFAVCPEYPWTVEYPESRDRAVVGAALTAVVSRRLEIAFRYEGKFGPGRVDTDINLGAMLKF